MLISGIGTVFSRGRGIDCFEAALETGWQPPARSDFNGTLKHPVPVYGVDENTLKEKALSRKIRRADRFCKMAVAAAWDAVQDSGLNVSGPKKTLGIIVATAFGPHTTTFRFLDDILDYGDANVSPTIFSHSVHNAAASYIASTLQAHGPTLTLTQFDFPFHHALVLAEAWLREGRCDTVLVGTVDELGPVMAYVCREKLRIAPDGKIQPFCFSAPPRIVPGEGSAFFLLRKVPCDKSYGMINTISLGIGTEKKDTPDIYILDTGGMSADETAYGRFARSGAIVAGYAPLFGSIATGAGFHCAAAALMLRKQKRYACPVQENPSGAEICTITETAALNTITCVKTGCDQTSATIELSRCAEQ